MMTKAEIKELVSTLAPTRNIYSDLLEMSEELTDIVLQLDEIPTYGLKMNYDQVQMIIRGFKSQIFDAQTAQRRGVWGTDLGMITQCMKNSIERANGFLEQWTEQAEEYEANY